MTAPATGGDVVVVGAGPSGSATALLLARAGHRVTVVDRCRFPRDKACGEGLMPPGVGVIRRLNLLDEVLAAGAPRLHCVAYQPLDRSCMAVADLPPSPRGTPRWGLGVRRTVFDAILVDALRRHPAVTLLECTSAAGLLREAGAVVGVASSAGELRSRAVVAADGLHSRLRAAAGWTSPPRRHGRYGLTGHWRADARAHRGITVTFAGDHEWYQAPVGPELLLVSVLAGRRRLGMVARDYMSAARSALPGLANAELVAPPLAAGQFHQRPRAIASDRLFLVGDAAGYDDPTTGEGLSIGLLLAERLAGWLDLRLRGALAPAAAAAGYRRDHARLWRDRRRVTRLALLMAATPSLSRRAIARAERRPEALAALLGINCGYWGFGRLTPRQWLTLAGI